MLELNYRTIKHHMEIFIKNDIVGSSSTGSYGDVYFLTPEMEGSMDDFDDIVSKYRSSKKLKDFTYSPQFFRKVVEETNDAVIITDSEGKIFFWNRSAEKLLGHTRNDVIGESSSLFLDERTGEKLFERVSSGEDIAAHEVRLKRKSNGTVDVDMSVSAIYDNEKNIIGYSFLSRDITQRKLAEERQKVTIALLERLNRSVGAREVIKDILGIVKDYTGFEAVGIRLKNENDYPYFITKGFPSHFVEAERYLCSYDEHGKLVYDDNKMPMLECMCGRVIRGKTDPEKKFFTSNGSFWTNDTNELLENNTLDDLGGRTRNRCNYEGFRSVALIPLRAKDDIIGLLQLNDRQECQFTPDMIDFFENIGSSIGIAFDRMRLEEAMKESSPVVSG